jgi:hypothetical protein
MAEDLASTSTAMDEDAKEEHAERLRKNMVDLDKLRADIASLLSLVSQVHSPTPIESRVLRLCSPVQYMIHGYRFARGTCIKQ